MASPSQQLIDLATQRFGLISRAERKMLEAVGKGQAADFAKDLFNVDDVITQTTCRTLSAEVVRWLCTDKAASALVGPAGVVIVFTRIRGDLNLSGLNIPYNLGLHRCEIPDGIMMRDSQLQTFNLEGTYCKHLIADRLKANGSVYLRFGFVAEGSVILANSLIKGDFDCTGGRFINPEVPSTPSARRRAYMLQRKGIAIALDRSHIEGDVFLRLQFHAVGEVRFTGATINGSLNCRGASFLNTGKPALTAILAKIRGSAVFNQLAFSQARTSTDGDIVLDGSAIGGSLNLSDVEFRDSSRNGLELRNATVGGPLIWKNVAINKKTRLRLSHSKVGQLFDERASWPRKNRISINGFTYDDLRGAPIDAHNRRKWLRARLNWLARQPRNEFSLQPYRQVAECLRRAGYEDNARTVLVDMYDARRKRGGLSKWGWIWSIILKWTIGYGYRSHRAFAWALLFMTVGAVVFYQANQSGLMVRIRPDSSVRFNSIAYSADTFLPIINLRQEEIWNPTTNSQRGFIVQIYLWSHILVGWILTTLGVAGFTGLIKRE